MIKSDTLGSLADALAKAQGAMKHAIKEASNPFFKSKYADLAAVVDASRPELAANGLSVVQLPTMRDGKLVLEYVLLHASGEYIGGELEMTPVKSDPQGIGSAITYARRYTLGGLTGVATEDDDGNAASGVQHKPVDEKRLDEVVTFPKPKNLAASNKAQGAGQSAMVGSVADVAPKPPTPSTAAVGSGEELTPAVDASASAAVDTNDASYVGYLTIQERRDFHDVCRKANPRLTRAKIDELTKQWLTDNKFVQNGKPTSAAIRQEHLGQVTKKCTTWLGVQ